MSEFENNLTASEQLDFIYEICCGEKPIRNQEQDFSKIEKQLQIALPDILKQFYQLFQKPEFMELLFGQEIDCYVIPPSELSGNSTNDMVKIAEDFKGCSQCYYCVSDQMIHVEYDNEDMEIIKPEEFVVIVALMQASFLLECNGLIDNAQIPPQLYSVHMDNEIWMISKKFKLLGVPYNDTQCLIFARDDSDLEQAEEELNLSIESL